MSVEHSNSQKLRNGAAISLWSIAAEAANGGQLRVTLYVEYEDAPYQTIEFVHSAPEVLKEGPLVLDLEDSDPD